MASEWVGIEPKSLNLSLSALENYEANADWLEFDCVCADTDAPDYENVPYDFVLKNLGAAHLTCGRCGRQYRVHIQIAVEMYEPLAIRYPGSEKSVPAKTLGLRTEE